jgi:predicted protein tyrosine phosphatase
MSARKQEGNDSINCHEGFMYRSTAVTLLLGGALAGHRAATETLRATRESRPVKTQALA